ncbi:hypothetical protein KVT40_007513 [Elsinoe batatas]|uniref:Uncharacterized protein n=1 Tax=Elsinoe batatas TaxID=2601811 RepID=A0A8K0KUV6_9PEZI|nr:hypothetical protein KVT40_007513 [Elsinoe batatas]
MTAKNCQSGCALVRCRSAACARRENNRTGPSAVEQRRTKRSYPACWVAFTQWSSTTTSAPPTRERQRQRNMTGHRDGGNWQSVDVSRGLCSHVNRLEPGLLGAHGSYHVRWLLIQSASRRSEGGRVQGEREIAAVGVRKSYRAPRPKEIGREGFTLEGRTVLMRSGASRTEHSTDRSVGGSRRCVSGVPLVWMAGMQMTNAAGLSRTTVQILRSQSLFNGGAASTDTGSNRRCQESGHDHSLYHLGKLVIIRTWPYPRDEAFPPVNGSHDMFY